MGSWHCKGKSFWWEFHQKDFPDISNIDVSKNYFSEMSETIFKSPRLDK